MVKNLLEHARHSPSFGLITLAVMTAISRIPFMGIDYGADPDSWRVAIAAKSIATDGVYAVSRFPGFPIHEFGSSLVVGGGPLAINGATALMSVIAVIFFALSLKQLQIRQYLWAGVALAFTPVFYVASVTSIDYVWALAFIMIGLYAVLRGWVIMAGVALGLAIGCRLTSGAMIIPLIWLIASTTVENKAGALAKMIAACAVVSILAFWPVYDRYGWDFLMVYESGYPPWLTILRRATVEVWGRIGLFALVASVTALWLRPRQVRSSTQSMLSDRARSPVWVVVILIYLALFLKLPHTPGYLIPAIPFVILLLARSLRRRYFLLFVGLVSLASFMSICRSRGICRGSILADAETRSMNHAYVDTIIDAAEKLPDSSIVVSGWWRPQLQVTAWDNPDIGSEFIYLIDSSAIADYASREVPIYYLPRMVTYNIDIHGIDLREHGARPLISGLP